MWRKYQFATYLRKFYAKNVHKNSVILGNLVQAVLALLVTFSMYAVMLLYDFLKKIYIITLNSAKKFNDHLFVFNTRNPKNVVKLLRVMLSWLAVELLRVCLCLKKMRPPGSTISPAWPMNCIEYRTPTESLLQSWWWYIFFKYTETGWNVRFYEVVFKLLWTVYYGYNYNTYLNHNFRRSNQITWISK